MDQELINFFSETEFEIEDVDRIKDWLLRVVVSEGKRIGEVGYIFCDDQYLLEINRKYLGHDTFTDIISFDNTLGVIISGDIFISVERVSENAINYNVSFDEELKRVMVHGVLHFCGYKDKTQKEAQLMREKEEEKIQMFHVEQ